MPKRVKRRKQFRGSMKGKALRGNKITNGYIEVENRKGVIEQFPLTSISIGVVEVDENTYYNILEIGEIGAQVKHLAKTVQGSTYVINKRKMS